MSFAQIGVAMQMHQVRYFLSVCEWENFTRAAERCNVSQPALTRAIRGLEAELGSRLFQRGHSRSRLTAFGQSIRPFLEQIAGLEKTAHAAASAWRGKSAGIIRLGISYAVGMGSFSTFAVQFGKRHPGIELEIVAEPVEEPYDILNRGEIEVAVVISPTTPDPRLAYRDIYDESLVVAFRTGHPFERRARIAVEDLQGETLLNQTPSTTKRLLRSAGVTADAYLNIVCQMRRPDWIVPMIARGAGIAILPETAMILPGVVTRPLVESWCTRSIALVTLSHLAPSAAASALLAFAE